MLRSHHHLRVYCVNGYGSFRLGYVGVGFGGNCDCRYGTLYAPMLGVVFAGLVIKHTTGMTHLRANQLCLSFFEKLVTR